MKSLLEWRKRSVALEMDFKLKNQGYIQEITKYENIVFFLKHCVFYENIMFLMGVYDFTVFGLFR